MTINNEYSHIDPARETASRFLEAVKNRDARAFWDSLDKKGQGYFLGLWFYAMETMSIETIMKLTGEQKFLDGVLGPVINGLRDRISELLDKPEFGEILYNTPHNASIMIYPSRKEDRNQEHEDSIPLVLELSDTGGGNVNFTCWKIDTLQCFQLVRNVH